MIYASSREYPKTEMTLDDKRDEILDSYGYTVDAVDIDSVGRQIGKAVVVHKIERRDGIDCKGERVGSFASRLVAIRQLLCPEYGKSIKSLQDLHHYTYKQGI